MERRRANDISATFAINTAPATDLFDFNAATGLVFDTSTGAISGELTVLQRSTRYTITASAKAPYIGSTSVTIQIVITTPLTGTFSYTNITATKDTAIAEDANLPQWTVAGQIVEYTIAPTAPALPTGLSINATTGAIIGTPTEQQASAEYTITANARALYVAPPGPITATISIKITASIDGSLSYSATEGTAIVDLTPSWSGRTDNAQSVKYIILPGLPNGLVFDTSTGVLSGTPTEVALENAREYSIEARGESSLYWYYKYHKHNKHSIKTTYSL